MYMKGTDRRAACVCKDNPLERQHHCVCKINSEGQQCMLCTWESRRRRKQECVWEARGAIGKKEEHNTEKELTEGKERCRTWGRMYSLLHRQEREGGGKGKERTRETFVTQKICLKNRHKKMVKKIIRGTLGLRKEQRKWEQQLEEKKKKILLVNRKHKSPVKTFKEKARA